MRELKELQDRSTNREHALEKELRAAQETARSLGEDVEEARSELATLERQDKHQLQEVETRHAKLQESMRELQASLEEKEHMLQVSQQRTLKGEADVGALESEVLRLKALGGDTEELVTVKRELSEQVAHIREMEKLSREQGAELRHFKQMHKAVAIVEEEKRALENKVRRMDDLERELGEARFQREILENERQSWTAYLKGSASEGPPEFDSPAMLAQALAQERLERASLAERLGALKPELTEKEGMIKALETTQTMMQSELQKLKTAGSTGGTSDNRAKVRLERQKALAVKEVEYLREQLKTFEAEDVTGEVRTDADEHTRKRISDLETLVAEYRKEVSTLQADLSRSEPPFASADPPSLKRPAPSDPAPDSERLGELTRKNRALQSELSVATSKTQHLTTELSATKTQLTTLQAASRTRVLSLRSNPTSNLEALKLSTITTLREENAALHAQLAGSQPRGKVVPVSYFDAANAEIAALQASVADKEKSMLRLKQVWSLKSLEFREAVASLLGWKMDFMPNGRFRMTSLFHSGDEEEGEGNSLVFDGDSGTMKISGGPESAFAREIRGLIRFWVEERKEIPAFLAACTLEFYERTTRAQRM